MAFFIKHVFLPCFFTLPDQKYSFLPFIEHGTSFINNEKQTAEKLYFLLVKASQGSKSTQNFGIL
jgi:hypothetical protein